MQAKKYIAELYTVFEKLALTNKRGEFVDFEKGIQEILALFRGLVVSDRKIIFIGNGASAAIASHMAIDYWKNGGIPSLCFNDGAQLTCLGNDYGFEAVFAKPVQFYSKPGDVLVAISSSGQSANILNGVEAATRIGCKIITLSGFSTINPLRKLGDYNIYCASSEYGFVELSHQMVLHMILDLMLAGGNGNGRESSPKQGGFSG